MTMEVPQLPSRSRMNITDIPAELQEKILRNIEDYSIILLVDGRLCGTGTLITIDGVHGILTAAHVAQTLDESERAGTLATVLDRRGITTRRRAWSFPLFSKTYLHAERAADPFESGTDLRGAAAHLSKQDSVIGNGRAEVRMFETGGGGKLKEDFQVPPHQRFGVREPVGGLEQLGQVVEVKSDSGMVGPEALLGYFQRQPIKRLRLRIVGSRIQKHGIAT
jgi:hypothetical protein